MKIHYEGKYEFIEASAIAVSAGDTKRQPAVLIHDTARECDNLAVYFGEYYNGMTLEDMDSSAVSFDAADLDSVRIIGHPLSAFVW